MGLRNTPDSFGSVARALHWLMFILLVAALVIGNYAASIPVGSVEKTQIRWYHESIGLTILLLLVSRLFWRLCNPGVQPVGISRPRMLMSRFIHGLLYVLMFLQSITGLVMVQAYGYPTTFFGLFTVPTLVPVDEGIGLVVGVAHGLLWVFLVFAASIHMLAALYHHFILGDGTLMRMLTGKSPES